MTPSLELIGDELGVQIIGDRDIVVRNAASNFTITYRKDALTPMLFALNGIGRTSEPSYVRFCAQAWKAGYHKARNLGWLST